MSKLSSVKMESIEFAKRHFNGSSNCYEEGEEDLEDEEDEDEGIVGEFEQLPHVHNEHDIVDIDRRSGSAAPSDHDKAIYEIGSSSNIKKTDNNSFETDLACFPNSNNI